MIYSRRWEQDSRVWRPLAHLCLEHTKLQWHSEKTWHDQNTSQNSSFIIKGIKIKKNIKMSRRGREAIYSGPTLRVGNWKERGSVTNSEFLFMESQVWGIWAPDWATLWSSTKKTSPLESSRLRTGRAGGLGEIETHSYLKSLRMNLFSVSAQKQQIEKYGCPSTSSRPH